MTTPNHTHTANTTKAAVQELDWEILPHPPYSPDLGPSDYHLLRSLSNNLRVISFNNEAEVQNWLDDFFTAKPEDLFKSGVENLQKRWEVVLNKLPIACHLLARWFAELFFDPEDGGDTFLRNVGYNSTHYTASYPRR
jgi:hypothetical protein